MVSRRAGHVSDSHSFYWLLAAVPPKAAVFLTLLGLKDLVTLLISNLVNSRNLWR